MKRNNFGFKGYAKAGFTVYAEKIHETGHRRATSGGTTYRVLKGNANESEAYMGQVVGIANLRRVFREFENGTRSTLSGVVR